MSKRILTGVFALMLALFVAAGAQAAPANATVITALDEEYVATINEGGEQAYFSFTPTTAGVYAFRSESNEDTYGRLYDSDMNLINSDDDGGNDVNFRIVNELSAGETYYYGASYLNHSNTGEFSVYLSRITMNAAAVGHNTWIQTSRPDETVQMSVMATTEHPPLSFAWYGPDGAMTSGVISSDNTSTLSVVVPADSDSRAYRCDVSDAGSETATIEFYTKYGNNLQANQYETETMYVAEGASVRLSAPATCRLGSLSYQWFRDGMPIDGATSSTLTVQGTAETVNYQCEATDEYGNGTYCEFYIAPDNGFYIRQMSQRRFVAPGSRLTLRADACSDDDQLTYTWYCNEMGDEDDYVVSGATGPAYTTPAITSRRVYSCDVTNSAGESRSIRYDICIDSGLEVTVDQYFGADCEYDGSVTLTPDVTCTLGSLHYNWRTWGDGNVNDNWPDAASITLTHVTHNMNAEVEVSDDYGNIVYYTWEVLVDSHTQVYVISPVSQQVAPGDEVTMALEAISEYGTVSYRWETGGSLIVGATGYSYTVPVVTRDDKYVCYVSDGLGNIWDYQFFVTTSQPETIALDTPVSCVISERNSKTYVFTPSTTGQYTIWSEGSGDPCVTLYDEQWRKVTNDDDGGDRLNFNLSCSLTAGSAYYFLISGYNDSEPTVTLTRGSAGTGESYPGVDYEYDVTLRVGQRVRFASQMRMGEVEEIRMPSTTALTRSGDTFTAAQAGTAKVYVLGANETDGYRRWELWNVTVVSGAKVVALPSGLTALGAEAFAGDTSVRFVTVGASVRTIGMSAFDSSGLQQVNIAGADTRLMGGSLLNCSAAVLCPEGSAAAAYCREYHYPFVYND